MISWIIFVFGLIVYALSMAGLIMFMLFVGGWHVLPWSIDAEATGPLGQALLINLGLILLFGLQHSVMARPGFKKAWTRIVPVSAERSYYCLGTVVAIALMCVLWQPMPGIIWSFQSPLLKISLTILQLCGWALVVASSFMINHFELFGLQQAYERLVGRHQPQPGLVLKYAYRFVRHPLQLGMLVGMWATPHMSSSHMFLAAGMTAYITVGLYLEERELAAFFGQKYEDYRLQVPMVLPNFRRYTPTVESLPACDSSQAMALTPGPK